VHPDILTEFEFAWNSLSPGRKSDWFRKAMCINDPLRISYEPFNAVFKAWGEDVSKTMWMQFGTLVIIIPANLDRNEIVLRWAKRLLE